MDARFPRFMKAARKRGGVLRVLRRVLLISGALVLVSLGGLWWWPIPLSGLEPRRSGVVEIHCG